ncbi:hypothetical protein [Picosynechococcus sp. PCC 7117]|uniref:hypothetical protein n=1 Tax=Picosynechococcus sp. PCC 7117 TaxID=195498 RepID=UPI000810D72E|nr:hypothetical protein [Picosynechococcus sp. PCC 7117]ANV88507.1 hypothetical protein AWQ22_14125 [Picosynechococcus sp. PCC 7117]
MTILQGTIKDSASNPLTGNLIVELAGVMVDNTTTPPSVLTPEPYTFYIVNGAVSVDIPESETEQNSYRLRFYVETAPGEFEDNPEFDFYTQIPNLATVDLVNLIPTGMVNDMLATGALRIAKLIINDPNLSTKVGGVFPEGDWDSETEYKRGSIVKYLNRAYIASIDAPAGALPTDTIYWMNLPTEPDGSLLLGDATPYDVSWNGSGLAASQDTVYDQIESVKSTVNTKANINSPTLTGTVTLPSTTSIGNVSSTEISYLDGVSSSIQTQLDSKAPLASPALTGTPTATTASLGDSSLRIATTAFVANAIAPKAPLASPELTGTPTAPTATLGTNTTQLATTAFVQANKRTDEEIEDLSAGLLTSGTHTDISVTYNDTAVPPTIDLEYTGTLNKTIIYSDSSASLGFTGLRRHPIDGIVRSVSYASISTVNDNFTLQPGNYLIELICRPLANEDPIVDIYLYDDDTEAVVTDLAGRNCQGEVRASTGNSNTAFQPGGTLSFLLTVSTARTFKVLLEASLSSNQAFNAGGQNGLQIVITPNAF